MIGDSRSHHTLFSVAFIVLVSALTACGTGNTSDQTLTVIKAGTGSGTVTATGVDCGDDCTGSYARGINVALTATPEDGSTFRGWSGDCTGTTCELVMDSMKTVTATFQETPNGPASVLGDSPTVTGSIVNLGRGNFSGKVLELKVGSFAAVVGDVDDVYATSPVADDGSFSLQLPGEAQMTPRLIDSRREIYAPEGCDASFTPADHKLSPAFDFFLYADAQLAQEVLPSSVDSPTSILVLYQYVDRDVTIAGACASGDLAGFTIDIDMRKGWNTLVYDFTTFESRSEDLNMGYQWVMPALCNTDGSCPSE